MVKFSVSEYVKNIMYNIISIVLLTGTFVACAIFTSNVSDQTKMNRFFAPYFDKNTIITGEMGADYDVEELELIKYEKSLCTKEIMTNCAEVDDLEWCVVYDDYVMNNLTPKLKSGSIVKNGSGDMMNVLLSENASGVEVGDVINLTFTVKDESQDRYTPAKKIIVPAKVTGIFESGQKLFFGAGVPVSNDMSLKDVVGTYHYEQLEYSMVIIPEKEFNKISEPIYSYTMRSVIKFQDDITREERLENYRKLIAYESEHCYATMIEVFPPSSDFVQMNKQETMDVIITNIPLFAAIAILVTVCIICMISIRNANSMKYYATLYICGMPIKNAVILAGIEMGINGIMAIILGTSVINIQMNREIFGKINCALNLEQWLIIIGISVFMVVAVMTTTFKTLKERSPMSVLRDTAY